MKVEGKLLRTRGGSAVSPLSASLYLVDNGSKLDFVPNGLRVLTPDGDSIPYDRVEEAAPTAAEYVGQYASDEAEVTYRIVVEEGKLVAKGRPDIAVPLTPLYADAFQVAANGWLVRFARNQGGKISGLSLGLGRVRDLRFARR